MLRNIARTALVGSLLTALTVGGSLVASADEGDGGHHRGKHHDAFGLFGRGGGEGGGMRLVRAALKKLDLTDAQRTQLQQLATAVKARHANTRARMKELALTVAGNIEDGRINRVALQTRLDALVAARQAVRPADRAAIEKLHAILTPAQRTQLVELIKQKLAKRAAKHGGWQGHAGKLGRLGKLAGDLQLTDQQKAQLRQAFVARHAKLAGQRGKGMAEAQARMTRLLDAFKGERFSMAQAAPPVDLKARTKQLSDRVLGGLEVMLPVLTPAQRATLAGKVRTAANRPAPTTTDR